MSQESSLDHLVRNIPHRPGVYKMKNKAGEIIYVGKAKDLRNRVSSYFQSRLDKTAKTLKMVEQIADIEYIEVATELEALILETNFIKELRPKYNILMKDDKSYVYIKITVNEPYPRIFLVRKVVRDKARYFGPKTAAHKVIKTLKVLKKIFPYRHCQLDIDLLAPGKVKVTNATIKYPCLDYHIKRCQGPCIAKVTQEEYRKTIDQVVRFLEGKHDEITEKLQEDMMRAASEKKFELAASIRDKLQAVQEITETQRISDPHQKDLDIINYVTQDEKIYFNLFQLRSGRLIGQENFVFEDRNQMKTSQIGVMEENREALSSFLWQYYEKATDLPQEMLVPHAIDDPETLEALLKEIKGTKVALIIPERGKKNQLLELSHANALSFARQSAVRWQGEEQQGRLKALEKLQVLLGLPEIPRRLECYDNSHFGGTETVSSMVVFENGFPKKSDYRHFKLSQETSGAPDDFASMEETLTRRLKYLRPSLASSGLKLSRPKKKDIIHLRTELHLPAPPNSHKKSSPQNSRTSLPPAQLLPPEPSLFVTDEALKERFWMLEKDLKPAGFIETRQLPNKRVVIEMMSLISDLDWALLTREILEKTKSRRLYLTAPESEKERWEALGYQSVSKAPEGMKDPVFCYDLARYSEDSSFKSVPHLIIIDGGKGQLHSAQKALQKYQFYVPMVSLAKREEEIFVPGQTDSIRLEKNDPLLRLFQHIRDEAHRFAITYHQNLRLKVSKSSVLDDIEGIGPESKIKLLQKFGSPDALQQASLEEISAVIGKEKASRVVAAFKK